MSKFDLVVIGSGPAGQKGAFAAAKLGKKVAIVEHAPATIGGVCLHSGTVPSKTLREAILHLTGFRQRGVYHEQFRSKRSITMDDLRKKLNRVIEAELETIHEQFERNGITVLTGEAQFLDPRRIAVRQRDDAVVLQTEKVLIACGTRPSRPAHIPFDGRVIFDSDEFLRIEKIPRSMIVIGAGVIGIEYAIMFAILGVEVTVVDARQTILDFCDAEIIETLLFNCRMLNMRFRLGESVSTVLRRSDGQVAVRLESQKHLVAESALFSVGRDGWIDSLNLRAAGLEANQRGRLDVTDYVTGVPHIYAAGDIVGFPSLASSAMEQGRRAVLKAYGQKAEPLGDLPYGLFTIPEISMIGKNEKELTAERIPYEVGMARYSEIARGKIIGDETGMLKILFQRHTKKILGVHCIGELATEIVHIGQTVMNFGGTIDYFCNTVFNYPTMAECYRVAAFNGLNRLCVETDCLQQTEGAVVQTPTNEEPTALVALPTVSEATRCLETEILATTTKLADNLKRISAPLVASTIPVVTMPSVSRT
jgi:NAD(P) transhydrogenase